MQNNEHNLSTLILQDVLQIGRLDFTKTMEGLMHITGSTNAHFFETDSIHFICRFTTGGHTIGQRYSFDELPPDNSPIMHKSNVIAFVCLDKQDAIDDMSEDDRQRIFDSICAGLVMGRLKDDNYAFAMSICKVLSKVVQQVLVLVTSLPQNTSSIRQIDSQLTDIIAIIFDAMDYLDIDAGKAEMITNSVNVLDFIKETISILQQDGSTMTHDVEDSVPDSVLLDRQRVQQMLMSVARKLTDLPGVRLNVKLENYSTADNPNSELFLYFHFFSGTTRQNQEIQRRFRVEQVSVGTLGIHVVKKLCEMMMGTFHANDHGVTLRIKVILPPTEHPVFKGQRILVAMTDRRQATQLVSLFDALGSQVTVLRDNLVLLQGSVFDGLALVAVDVGFIDVARTAMRRGIPVLGIGNGLEESWTNAVLASVPVSGQELINKCLGLTDRRGLRRP